VKQFIGVTTVQMLLELSVENQAGSKNSLNILFDFVNKDGKYLTIWVPIFD
jgi:hypothetical protein